MTFSEVRSVLINFSVQRDVLDETFRAFFTDPLSIDREECKQKIHNIEKPKYFSFAPRSESKSCLLIYFPNNKWYFIQNRGTPNIIRNKYYVFILYTHYFMFHIQ